MKYIFVVRQLTSGGAENATIILGKELSSRGHTVEVWNLGVDSTNDMPKWNSWAKVNKITPLTLLLFRPKNNERMILVNNVGYKYVKPKNAISILHGDCTERFSLANNLFYKIYEFLRIRNRFSKRKNIIISEILANKLELFTNHPVKYIPNPFDPNKVIIKSNENLEINLPDNFIVHVGRLSYQKNQEHILLDYLSNEELYNKVDLVFIGGDSSKEKNTEKKLLQLIKNHPLENKVHFLGDIINPYPIIKKSKCLILCSRFESMGYVLLEAMVLNIPIVSTNKQGPYEVLGNEFLGLVADNENLSHTIIKAINNPKLYKKKLPTRYNKEKVCDEFELFTKE
ncbi:glycosyltransferase [Photobacterium leiognathi]|uniref:glycosyltransferase n=1 Tax=Photobacterium leiognathi TaxID=553611 RepID=UPI0029828B44|nr:glycosyltransferase [Photobacterium leiognathi]